MVDAVHQVLVLPLLPLPPFRRALTEHYPADTCCGSPPSLPGRYLRVNRRLPDSPGLPHYAMLPKHFAAQFRLNTIYRVEQTRTCYLLMPVSFPNGLKTPAFRLYRPGFYVLLPPGLLGGMPTPFYGLVLLPAVWSAAPPANALFLPVLLVRCITQPLVPCVKVEHYAHLPPLCTKDAPVYCLRFAHTLPASFSFWFRCCLPGLNWFCRCPPTRVGPAGPQHNIAPAPFCWLPVGYACCLPSACHTAVGLVCLQHC